MAHVGFLPRALVTNGVLPAGLCTELGSACFESGGYAASDGYILLVEYRGTVLSLSIEWINLLRTSDMVFRPKRVAVVQSTPNFSVTDQLVVCALTGQPEFPSTICAHC